MKVMEGTFTNSLIRSHVKQGYKYGAQVTLIHAYFWNKEDQLVYKPDVLRCGWWIHFAFIFTHASFVIYRSAQTNLDSSVHQSVKIFTQFMAVYFAFPFVFLGAYYFSGDEQAGWVNDSYFTWKRLEVHPVARLVSGKNSKGHVRLMQLCSFFIINFKLGVYFVSLYMTLRPILYPASPEQWTSIMPNPFDLTLMERLPFALFIAYIEYVYHAFCFYQCYQYLSFVFSILVALKAICYHRPINKAAWHMNITVDVEERFRLYTQIRLLCDRMNRAGKVLLPGALVVLSIMTTFAIYGSIRFSGPVAISMTIFGSICVAWLTIVFGTFAKMHEWSGNFLESLSFAPPAEDYKRKWIQRKVRSLHNIRIACSLFYVDQGMIFTMLQAITNITINVLVAY